MESYDVHAYILSFLTQPDISACCLVNRSWYDFSIRHLYRSPRVSTDRQLELLNAQLMKRQDRRGWVRELSVGGMRVSMPLHLFLDLLGEVVVVVGCASGSEGRVGYGGGLRCLDVKPGVGCGVYWSHIVNDGRFKTFLASLKHKYPSLMIRS